MPDWLALVGDAADGIPGIPGWGEKSAGAVLARYGRLEAIPDDAAAWDVAVRGRDRLAESLRERREDAALYRRLATLRTDVPLAESLEDLEWRGARRGDLEALCREIGAEELLAAVLALAPGLTPRPPGEGRRRDDRMRPGTAHLVPEGTVPMKRPRVLVLAAAAAPTAVEPGPGPCRRPSEWLGGGGLLVGVPLGEFADATDEGFGVAGTSCSPPGVDRSASASRRAGPGLWQPDDRHAGARDGGLVTEDLTTDNWLLNAGLGPQVMLRSGTVRPYAYALAGVGYFGDRYVARRRLRYDGYRYDELRRHHVRLVGGGWPADPVSRSVAIDLGVQYVGNGTVRYLAKAISSRRRVNAPPVIVPRKTEANLLTITVGVMFW